MVSSYSTGDSSQLISRPPATAPTTLLGPSTTGPLASGPLAADPSANGPSANGKLERILGCVVVVRTHRRARMNRRPVAQIRDGPARLGGVVVGQDVHRDLYPIAWHGGRHEKGRWGGGRSERRGGGDRRRGGEGRRRGEGAALRRPEGRRGVFITESSKDATSTPSAVTR